MFSSSHSDDVGVGMFIIGFSSGPEATGTQWNTGDCLWTSGNRFLLWVWLSVGAVCPERFWGLCVWRYSKAVWAQSWGTGSR